MTGLIRCGKTMCHRKDCMDCYPGFAAEEVDGKFKVNCIEAAIEKAESGGGSSSYYELPSDAKELDDLIVAKKMPWHIANIFKACYRWGEKNSNEYEADKIEWMANQLQKAVKAGKL